MHKAEPTCENCGRRLTFLHSDRGGKAWFCVPCTKLFAKNPPPEREATATPVKAPKEYVPEVSESATPAPARGTDSRSCTCHPDDNPPVPCQRKYALTECRIAEKDAQIAALREALQQAHEAMEAFTDPEGNMPADTGEFRELKAAMLSAEKTLGGAK